MRPWPLTLWPWTEVCTGPFFIPVRPSPTQPSPTRPDPAQPDPARPGARPGPTRPSPARPVFIYFIHYFISCINSQEKVRNTWNWTSSEELNWHCTYRVGKNNGPFLKVYNSCIRCRRKALDIYFLIYLLKCLVLYQEQDRYFECRHI